MKILRRLGGTLLLLLFSTITACGRPVLIDAPPDAAEAEGGGTVDADGGDPGGAALGDDAIFSGDEGAQGGDANGGDSGYGDSGAASGDALAVENVCARIEELAAHCPGYAYDCPLHPVEESICFLEMLDGLADPCQAFFDGPKCDGVGGITIYVSITCWLQGCFGINDPETCRESYRLQCSIF